MCLHATFLFWLSVFTSNVLQQFSASQMAPKKQQAKKGENQEAEVQAKQIDCSNIVITATLNMLRDHFPGVSSECLNTRSARNKFFDRMSKVMGNFSHAFKKRTEQKCLIACTAVQNGAELEKEIIQWVNKRDHMDIIVKELALVRIFST